VGISVRVGGLPIRFRRLRVRLEPGRRGLGGRAPLREVRALELKLARARGKDVLYSAYAEDYAGLFDRFDVVLSTRIHGCGIASSLGIPNVLIPHDGRSQTALKFGSCVAESANSAFSLSTTQVTAVGSGPGARGKIVSGKKISKS
jgi:hypothetical protein